MQHYQVSVAVVLEGGTWQRYLAEVNASSPSVASMMVRNLAADAFVDEDVVVIDTISVLKISALNPTADQ